MSTQYQIYHESVVRLAATLVIKDSMSCEIVNQRLRMLGYTVDPTDPETWKYYLNLAGQYHASDTRMYVTSMDTQEEIEMTPANMLIHRATWREYQYGSRYYNELIKRYPSQDVLINGILNPVALETAIAAPDHTILYYDANLIESRETNLIPNLQKWIKGQFVRWSNIDYRINNAYFIAAMISILFMAIPEQIKLIRTSNCRTNRVHSYHIRRYLASFGPLDGHYDNMNDFQRLWFYRNIRHVMRNAGKQITFETLINRLMTERRLPLAEYLIQHNDSTLPEQFDPDIQFERRSINGLSSAMGDDIIDTKYLLELENPIASGNVDEQTYAESAVPAASVRGLSSESKTKVLESNVLDLKESDTSTLSDVLFNQWIYWADKGTYKTVLIITLPDGGDGIRLSMKEGFILFLYLYYKRMGIDLPTIPPVLAKRVRREPMPTYEELKALTSDSTPDLFINEAMRNNVNITSYVSVDSFVEACTAIHQRMRLHRDLYVYRNDGVQYAEVRQITDRFYADVRVDMDSGENFAGWLRDRGLVMDKYSTFELNNIMENILNQATGQDLVSTQDLASIQRSMIEILKQLSSYSVQFIQRINEDAIVNLDTQHIRWHDQGGYSSHHQILPMLPASILGLTGIGHDALTDVINKMQMSIEPTRLEDQVYFDLGLEMEMSGFNNTLLEGMMLGTVAASLNEASFDLTELNGEVVTSPGISDRSIGDLFIRTETNDFDHP